METSTTKSKCCAAPDKSWLKEIPEITCIELQETAKLLPLFTNTEEKEDEMTEEEINSIAQLNPRPSPVSIFDDQGAELFADPNPRMKPTSTKKLPKVPLVPSIFSSEVIPQHTVTHPQRRRFVPDISIEDISHYNEGPSSSEAAYWHPPSALTNNRLVIPSSDRSSIPKLPQIRAPHKPPILPSRLRHRSQDPMPHQSHLLPSDSRKKPTAPHQLQNVRHQHQKPLQDTSRAIHPSGIVGGSFNARRRQLSHPRYVRRDEPPVDFTELVVSHGATATAECPEPLYVNPQPQVNRSLKSDSVQEPFDYLRKTSRKIPPHKPAKPSKEIEPVEELECGLMEKESSPLEKEDRKRQITRKATLLHFKEPDKKAAYLVDFKNVKMDAKRRYLVNRFRGGVISKLENLTDEIRDDYDDFLSEIDTVSYYARRQAEEMLQNYSPRKVLVISSAVPKVELLKEAIKPDVLTLIYDFEKESYVSLLKEMLDDYMSGAKAKYITFVCKGGPGYMYLLQRKPITPAKLLKDDDLLKFWKQIGFLTSKIPWDETPVVYIMESNVAGNEQGVELLSNLEAAMFTDKVSVLSPLESGAKGFEMINAYFFHEKFNLWKSTRYPKIRLYRTKDQ